VSALPVAPTSGALRPVPLDHVRITGGYWADRQQINASATLQHCVYWLDRLGWVSNFTKVAAGGEFSRAGREFSDSEIYKIIEALAWEQARTGLDWAGEAYARLTAEVIAAQQPDGYVNTNFGSPGQQPRYSDLDWGHELYCAGHLIQAAVARLRTAGRDDFVDAAVRLADHICREFGPDGRDGICGHPEIEVALAELGRALDDRTYLDQARLFIDRRGHGQLDGTLFGSSYFQDDEPVREATVLRGHAVRALYLSAGAMDVAVEYDDDEMRAALQTQWANTVARRTYLTGGMGSRHDGESFGSDFELPSDRAYCETCAGVGSIMFSWRLLLAGGGNEYADLIERTLYNVVAASAEADGTRFFYVNPLERNELGAPVPDDEVSPRASSSERAPWFTVSCCPTNIARTLASLSAYVATTDESGLQLHQFVEGEIDTTLTDGSPVGLSIRTDYPHRGRVSITVRQAPSYPWTLSLRVPSWAAGRATITVGGATSAVPSTHAEVERVFVPGETVELELPMEPRFTSADPRIDALRAQVAVERGPLVYCLESVDLPPDVALDRVDVDRAIPPTDDARGSVFVSATARSADDGGWPYCAVDGEDRASQPPPAQSPEPLAVRLIPYNSWAERGPSTMRVWLPKSG
jgi:DUF1680 family protein